MTESPQVMSASERPDLHKFKAIAAPGPSLDTIRQSQHSGVVLKECVQMTGVRVGL